MTAAAAARTTEVLSLRQLPRNRAGDAIWEVTNETDKTAYTVVVAATGPLCDCPHFLRRHRECKHIREVRNAQEAATAPVELRVPRPGGNGTKSRAQPADPHEHRSRFGLLGPEDLLKLPAQTWWIDSLLPVGGLAVLYGAPGSGKSFLALAWAIALAADRPWLGRRALWSPAAYVASEGAHGLGVRLRAALDAQEIETAALTDRFAVVPETVNLMDAGAVADLLAELQAYFGCAPGLVVIDTLSRAMPGGDENSVRDVSAAIAGADAIRRATPACVLLVHHTQKTGELERGSSALRGAADTMLLLRQEDDRLILECTKQRNAAPIPPLALRLAPVGASCTVEPAEGHAVSVGLSRAQREMLKVIDDVQQDGWAASGTVVRIAEKSGVAPRSAYRALKALQADGLLEKKGARYALNQRSRAALNTATQLAAVIGAA